jgi:glyoxylase-like metal-dependent hydrolase (beta-lactamase superfamily II)
VREAEVAPGVWLVNLPLPFPVGSINVYLIRTEDGFLLLDCGLKSKACREALAAALERLGIAWTSLRRILISHLHPDHFGLAAELRRLSGAEVLMHRVEASLVLPRWRDQEVVARHWDWLAEHGVPPGDSAEIEQASRGVAEFVDAFEVDRALEDGDRLPVAGGEMEVLWTPGHSPGLITLYSHGRRLFFSSDHIIEKITPNIGLHSAAGGDPLADYLRSLDRLRSLEIDWILPSHGHPFRGHREWIAATEEHHRARCERMRAAVAGATRTAYEIVGIEWGNHLSPLNERFAVVETLAHLEYMRRRGRVTARRDGNITRWEAA